MVSRTVSFSESRLLQRNAQPLAHFAGVLAPGVAENRNLAGCRLQQSLKNFDCRGLPCSVGAEESEALAGLNLEVQPAHGFELAVVGLAQVATLDSNGH
jgi:hypothetical protein